MSDVSSGQPGSPSSAGAARRAVWWLLGGLGLLALTVVATAPELLGDLSGLGGVILLAAGAGIPGLLIVAVVASRRRRGRERGRHADIADRRVRDQGPGDVGPGDVGPGDVGPGGVEPGVEEGG